MNQNTQIKFVKETIPAGFLERMALLLGDEYEAFIASYSRPVRPSLRLGLKASEEEARRLVPFIGTPVPWYHAGFYVADMPTEPSDLATDEKPCYRPGKHPFHEAGLYYIQEASAMLPASLCPPCPGERVLDLCAAPGGKTTQLATSMQGEGLLVANEIHPGRAAILSQNVERMGIPNAVVTNESPASLASRFPAFFDKIVVDAPCSGEGMFRKEPDAVRMWSLENIALCAERQAGILDEAASMLAPDGYLTYSTCTFAPEENEGTILSFLLRHPEFEVISSRETAVMDGLKAGILDSGRPEWVTHADDCRYPAEVFDSLRNCYRVFPHHADGEGHFACLMHKKKGDSSEVERKGRMATDGRFSKQSGRGDDRATAEAYAVLIAFLKEIGLELPACMQEAVPCLFGNKLSLVPAALCRHKNASSSAVLAAIKGLRVLRAGLSVGESFPSTRPGGRSRFDPDHALALAFFSRCTHDVFPLETLPDATAAADAYLRGEILPAPGIHGWRLITLGGIPLGWGKASDGMMKNHYPKGLRR